MSTPAARSNGAAQANWLSILVRLLELLNIEQATVTATTTNAHKIADRVPDVITDTPVDVTTSHRIVAR
ncbi:hypothetical protein [Rhodococcus sp. EPR-157]|uniref:hypothetical protein n=1 Tax=Rhodococcus sp. EPR-157 TaxID=1813677 RepID=UPI001E3862DE|nr:hypothetical protein [Rhodococcus sp. EPR-157]